MPLSENERQILLFNLHAVMVPDEAPLMSVSELVDMLKETFDTGRAHMLIGEQIGEEDEDEGDQEEPANVILIRAMEIDREGTVTILLHHGDASAADPALMQIQSGKVRNAGKRPDEGLAHAAHLIISTKRHASRSGQSRALLERVPNLGRSRVMAFLNRLLREGAAGEPLEFEDPDTRRAKHYHPKLAAQQQLW